MPIGAPLPSTTGTPLIRFSTRSADIFRIGVSDATDTTSRVMT
jgi:hypothetical protein